MKNNSNRYNVKISGISNEISGQEFEQILIRIWKDSGIDVNPLDIEGYHRLSLGKNGVNTTKRVIVKFVNIKHSEAMLQHKNGY